LALRLHGRGLRVRWAWFRNDVQDAIVWYPNSQATSRASNIGRTRTIGHELELAADLGSHASGWLSLTQQEARDVGIDPVYAGKDLPHQPRWTVAVGGVVRRDGWALRGRLLAEAGHWRDRYNGPGARVLARTLTSLALTRAWDHARLLQDRELRLTLEILNLTDTAARDLDGYPLPGRSLRATALIR
ncbi:TonB-dependent receptor, partial [bacterium]|nr:TonB-dependent receptor [bacterium]